MLPSRTKPFKHDYLAILAKYPANASLAYIAEREGIRLDTLRNIVWRFKLRPRQRKPQRRGVKDGRNEAFQILLDAINELRTRDLTGPEVCGELTDIILDTMERT